MLSGHLSDLIKTACSDLPVLTEPTRKKPVCRVVQDCIVVETKDTLCFQLSGILSQPYVTQLQLELTYIYKATVPQAACAAAADLPGLSSFLLFI